MKYKCGNSRFIAHKSAVTILLLMNREALLKITVFMILVLHMAHLPVTICGAESDELPQNKVEMQCRQKIETLC